MKTIEFSTLKNKIISKIENLSSGQEGCFGYSFENEALLFYTVDGEHFALTHERDCCEHVYIESIVGDLDDLLNTPIIMAQDVIKHGDNKYESSTWSFYKLATIKGYVDIRFFGESNGYYSETANLYKLN